MRAAAAIVVALTLVACSGSSGDGAATTVSTDPANVTANDTTNEPTSTTVSDPSTVAATTTLASVPNGPVVQPAQPTAGPGGSDYEHGDWRESGGGEGADAWYVFEPIDPAPPTARVAIVLHGYYEFAGYDSMYEFIRHTVRHGTIVIYPRWQTDIAVPCPGPYDIEPCITSALNGIRGALDFLASDPTRVQPELDEVSYYGFSFGGIVVTDLVNRWRSLDLPRPAVVMLDDPHDGGLTAPGEPSLDDSLTGIPSTTLFQCHSGATGVIAEPGKSLSSCNAVFRLLDHIPAANKDLVLTVNDTHGDAPLSSGHGVCASRAGEADAYDWNFCWKVWDALRSEAFDGVDGEYALGDTSEHRSNGEWSDGSPIATLVIQDAPPLTP